MHLSPDEIERRTFAIEDRGYDRDQVRDFLLEVASSLRLALHTTLPPAPARSAAEIQRDRPADAGPDSRGPARPGADAGPARARSDPQPDADQFARLGTEVAEVLRSAHDAVAALHAQADLEIEARQEEATQRAEDLRRQADADAAWIHDRAKRVLITAQEQADAIVAEAEATAAEQLQAARRQAKEHADQVATRTRRHAEQILRAEREALRRLHQAKAGVAAAVEMLTGSETRPVVDLTELRPNVRLGSIRVDMPDDDDDVPPLTQDDPLARMIRNAVDRAAAHAEDADAGEDDVDRDEVDDAGVLDRAAATDGRRPAHPPAIGDLAADPAPTTRPDPGPAGRTPNRRAGDPARTAYAAPVAPVRRTRIDAVASDPAGGAPASTDPGSTGPGATFTTRSTASSTTGSATAGPGGPGSPAVGSSGPAPPGAGESSIPAP